MELIFSARIIGLNNSYEPLGLYGLRADTKIIGGSGAPEEPYRIKLTISNESKDTFCGIIHAEMRFDKENPRFFMPAFMYGRNRGECPQYVENKFPRLRENCDELPSSSWWMVRGDRLSHPAVFIFDSGKVYGLCVPPYIKNADGGFGQFCGYSCSLQNGTAGWTLGYENAPFLFISSHNIREREAEPFTLNVGEHICVEMYLYEYAAENETGINIALRNTYYTYYEPPRKGAEVKEAIKDYQPKEAYYAILDPDKYLEEHPYTAKTTTHGTAIKGTPEIDGSAEALWDNVPESKINKYVMAWQGANGTLKCMWDENNLYVLMNVKDSLLSTASSEAHMQDSVEVFVDENNGKTTYYEDDDAQYRVSCENVQSFGTGASADGFKTAVEKTGDGYIVEMAIPFKTPRTGTGIIGFDAQINDDSKGDGNRTSVAKFNDMTDLSWGNTENWGEMFLTENGETDDILVNLNGRTLSFDVPPMIINDRTMVPFRTILEALGATVEYQEEGQYITASEGDTLIQMQIDNNAATVNGEETELDSPPVIIDGRTLVPVRFISEALNASVDWNAETKVVSIIPQ